MDAKAINQTVGVISLLGYELKKAGGYHVGACPFCGGVDRFTVKSTRDGDRWHCRQCGDGKYHTVIDLVMRRDNVNFKTALQTLGGDAGRAPLFAPRMVQNPTRPKPIILPAAGWQADAFTEITTAAEALNNSDIACAWLSARALAVSTWEAWLLGSMFVYDPIAKRKRAAITIPWHDWDAASEMITAVKYRFIDDDPNPKALRYSSKKGSTFDMPFGLWAALPNYHHTLALFEGELNCLSAWQCQPAGVDTLSFGSEGGGSARVLQTLAARYENVFVWADDIWDDTKKKARAAELQSLVTGRGKLLRSPKENGVKYDANQLLQIGALPEFLSRVLGVDC